MYAVLHFYFCPYVCTHCPHVPFDLGLCPRLSHMGHQTYNAGLSLRSFVRAPTVQPNVCQGQK